MSQNKQARKAGLSPIVVQYGRALAKWLNDSKGTPENRRVCALIQDFKAVKLSVKGYYFPITTIVDGRRVSGKLPIEIASKDGRAAKNRKYAIRMSRLEKKIRSYTYYRHPNYPLDCQWNISWEPAGKRARRDPLFLDEHGAVRFLCELAEAGDVALRRLRNCECECGAWLFGKRSTKRFINDNHRQKADAGKRSSLRFKKYRSEYMRNYRAREEERNRILKEINRKSATARR